MKNVLKITLITFLFCLAFNINKGNAQDQTVISDSIYSNTLKEQRSIKIKLPDQYKPDSEEKYDVIYIIDGEWNLDNFTFIYKFAKNENFVPPVIIVAIPNTYIEGANMRERDFLPEKVKGNTLAEGANNFIAFMKNELIPYINRKYPTTGDNSLFGHSYGGLFTMYALLKEPQLFNTYYCSDPSFWWNNGYMHKLATNTFENTHVLDKTLWINGIESTYKNMGIDVMDSILKVKAPKRLRWKIMMFPNETHNSVRLKGIYDGIKFAYDGYSTKGVEFHPMSGILLKDKPTKVFVIGNYPNLHYTTNGTEPDTNSAVAGQVVEISGPAKLVMKSFGSNKKYSTSGKGDFELGQVLPAIQKLKNIQKGGLNYSYYEGKWEKLPDFSKLKPVKTGIADSTFKLGKFSQYNYGCVFEGYLKIEIDGYYLFGLDSNDGSKLYLNGKQLIENDGLHGTENIKSYVVPLQKGFYPIKVEFFQGEGGADLKLIYMIPNGQNPLPIPHELLYSKT